MSPGQRSCPSVPHWGWSFLMSCLLGSSWGWCLPHIEESRSSLSRSEQQQQNLQCICRIGDTQELLTMQNYWRKRARKHFKVFLGLKCIVWRYLFHWEYFRVLCKCASIPLDDHPPSWGWSFLRLGKQQSIIRKLSSSFKSIEIYKKIIFKIL